MKCKIFILVAKIEKALRPMQSKLDINRIRNNNVL